MKIGFLFEDKFLSYANFKNVSKGNPGCGGAEYQMALLFTELSRNIKYNIIVFNYNMTTKFANNVKNILINNLGDIKDDIDMTMIINFTNELQTDELYNFIKSSKMNFIIWVHCRLNKEKIREFSKLENIKKIVFVTPLEMEILGKNILKKKVSIFNMIPEPVGELNFYKKKDNIVVYVGNISRYKGFINLLYQWKQIKLNVKDAQLFVIGNGSLYNRHQKFSKLNLCKPDYEYEIQNVLLKDNILDSVHFLGLMGYNKKQIIKRAKVGIVTNQNVETFCITALEYQKYGVPVVALNKDGLKYSVQNGKSGILCETFEEMGKQIIKILKEEYKFDLPNKFLEQFYCKNIISKWEDLLNNVE